VEFNAVVEISRPRVLYRRQGTTFKASISDVMADATWQAITSWCRHNKDELQNSVHCLLPQRKMGKFKAFGVKKDVPRMEMVHHQGRDGGVEHPLTGCSARDRVSPHH
jgi:hypothetical protein